MSFLCPDLPDLPDLPNHPDLPLPDLPDLSNHLDLPDLPDHLPGARNKCRIVLKHYFRQSGRWRKMKIMSSALKSQVLYYKLFKEFCKCNEASSYFIETNLPNYSIDIAKQLEAGIT